MTARSSSRPSVVRWVLTTSLVCCASISCSIDSRHLELAPPSNADSAGSDSPSGFAGSPGGAQSGTGGRGGASNNTGGRGGLGGSNGRATEPPPIIEGCVDLDRNGIGDCKETLAKNADFASDVSAWTAEQDTTLEWDEHDAQNDGSSGSALVSSVGVIDANSTNSVLRSASQCLSVGGTQLVTVYANAFVESGQSDPSGRAQIVVFFFDGENCTGAFTNSFTTPQPIDVDGVDSWLELKAGSVSSSSTKSMLVKLGLSRAYDAESFRARFDNILVKAKEPSG